MDEKATMFSDARIPLHPEQRNRAKYSSSGPPHVNGPVVNTTAALFFHDEA